MTGWIVVAVTLGGSIALYVLATIWDVRHDTKHAPRVDMFLCDKHGAIPMQYVVQLDGLTEKPFPYCPFCFSDKMKVAANANKKSK